MTSENFKLFINKSISEKIALVWTHPKERIIAGWNDTNAPIYFISTKFYVTDVIGLENANNSTLTRGQFFFDDITKILYVRHLNDESPKTVFTVVEYRLFFSDCPLSLPYDLLEGREVPYKALLKTSGRYKEDIDADDLTGISLSAKSKIEFINDSYFDSIYEKLSWDKTRIEIYLYSRELYLDEKEIIFKGFIDSKNISPSKIYFNVKTFVENLKNDVPLPYYGASDGRLSEDVKGKPKRRIYGRADVRVQSLDMLLEGLELSGTFSCDTGTGNKIIIATNGELLKELSPEDLISYTFKEETFECSVDKVYENSFTVTEEIEKSFSDLKISNRPAFSFYKYNRKHLIAHHKLREPVANITNPKYLNRLIVDSVSDLEAGDYVFINSFKRKIRRISGLEVVLETNLNVLPSVGDTIVKSGIQRASVFKKDLVLTRDYTLSNDDESFLILDDMTEVNIVRPVNFNSCTFTNGSRTVSGTGLNGLKTRQWIKPQGTVDFYEILQVNSDTEMELREAYAGATVTNITLLKKPEYIKDETIITADVYGKTDSEGNLIATASQIVKDLLIESGLQESDLDIDSFSRMECEAAYLMSAKIPFNFGGSRPSVKSCIDKINKSISGNLFTDTGEKVSYAALTPDKSSCDVVIRDHDLIGDFSIKSTGKNIVKDIVVNYRHFDADKNSDESGAQTFPIENEFVENVTNITKSEEIDIYVYRESDAQTLGQRLGLMRESSNTVITFETSLKLIKKSLNDSIYLELTGLPERFGSSDKTMIGYITSISKTTEGSRISVSNLSGLYDRIATIASDIASEYVNSTQRERALNGFITDNDGIINDEQNTYRCNLIG